MKAIARCIPLLLVAACAKGDKPAADAAAGAAAAAPAINLQDVAGTWAMRTTMEGSDSVMLTFQLNATDSESGWTLNFPGRDPVPLRVVAVAGDSIVTEAGPYESMLRKGVQVSTRGVMRLSNGRLVGSTVATYSGGEEIRLKTEGMRP